MAPLTASKRESLNIVLPPHATFERWKNVGLFDRQKKYYRYMNQFFDVAIFSADVKDYSEDIGIRHYHPALQSNQFGYRHLNYYLFLCLHARRLRGISRVFGVSIPFLKFIKRRSKSKIVLSYHNNWAEGIKKDYPNIINSFVPAYIQKSALQSADVLLLTHEWLKDHLPADVTKQIYVNPNFVDPEIFYPEKKEKIILFAGRIHDSKGIFELLQAFSQFALRNSSYNLIFIGFGEDADKLIRTIEELKLRESVRYLGKQSQEEMAHWMRRAEIFVLPSRNMEGHPKSLIEAMACKCVCLVTDVPGNNSLITNGVNGILVSPNAAAAILAGLGEAAGAAATARRLAERAYNDVKDLFFENVVNKEIEILRGLAGT